MVRKIIVIGGGFAGSCVARSFDKDENFDVTLIDNKNYFEFTPSILRVIVEPEHLKKVQVLHNHYLHRSKVIVGNVTEISEKKIKVKSESKYKDLEYDYLVICSGSSYSFPFKDKNLVLPVRGERLRDEFERLRNSGSVLIVGGGLVGVELAAEIIGMYPDKKIKIVQSGDKLIPRNNKRAQELAEKFLVKNGIEILFNERIKEGNGEGFVSKTGKKLKADMYFLCTGITPNFDFMKKNLSGKLNDKNQIEVNEFLQVKGLKNVFCAGDVNSVSEEKTAQNAEDQAKIVVKNIGNLKRGKELCEYKPEERIMVISLGKRDGIVTRGNFSLGGFIPAFLKRFVEWKEMMKFK